MYDSFTRVSLHASASLTVEGRHSLLLTTRTSVRCNPVGIFINTFMTLLSAYPSRSCNFPLNLPLSDVVISGNLF